MYFVSAVENSAKLSKDYPFYLHLLVVFFSNIFICIHLYTSIFISAYAKNNNIKTYNLLRQTVRLVAVT